MNSQADAILDYLKHGHSLTPLEALNWFGTFRLGARIYDLKRRGVKIRTDLVPMGDKYVACYRLDVA